MLQNIHRKYHVGTKHHVKMISNPLLITMQQKSWVEIETHQNNLRKREK
jgi:hypothetical protein